MNIQIERKVVSQCQNQFSCENQFNRPHKLKSRRIRFYFFFFFFFLSLLHLLRQRCDTFTYTAASMAFNTRIVYVLFTLELFENDSLGTPNAHCFFFFSTFVLHNFSSSSSSLFSTSNFILFNVHIDLIKFEKKNPNYLKNF